MRRMVAALERAAIPYMVTGSFASIAYGPRSTQDIDAYVECWAPALGVADLWSTTR